MRTKEKKQRENVVKFVFLFTILVFAIVATLSPKAYAKVYTVQNSSVDQFVVNGSSGNIILNPNFGGKL